MLKISPMDLNISYWRDNGIKIGDNCHIYSDISIGRDCFLLEIGNNVTISGGVKFLMHDNAPIKYTKGKYTDILGKVTIGDNCFIGWGTIVLPGVSIASDVVVGAGSVVTKSIGTEGVVVTGNPAKIVCSVKEYIDKNQKYLVNLDGMTKMEIEKYFQSNPQKLVPKKVIE